MQSSATDMRSRGVWNAQGQMSVALNDRLIGMAFPAAVL
jgi:hypothetical protein